MDKVYIVVYHDEDEVAPLIHRVFTNEVAAKNFVDNRWKYEIIEKEIDYE